MLLVLLQFYLPHAASASGATISQQARMLSPCIIVLLVGDAEASDCCKNKAYGEGFVLRTATISNIIYISQLALHNVAFLQAWNNIRELIRRKRRARSGVVVAV
jgi:hypothetical protein